MKQIVLNRQKLGLEDLSFGVGTEEQVRAGIIVTINKINAGNLPFDETRTLLEFAQDANIEALGAIVNKLSAIGDNLTQINATFDNLVGINSIVSNLSELLLVNDNAAQVSSDKVTVANDKVTVANYKAAVETMKLAVETIYDTFDDRFLGSKVNEPIVDNDGNALRDGAMYFNTSSNALKVYDLGNTLWVTIPQIYLSGLLDVTLTSITTGDILTWNGSKWINTRTPSFYSLKLNGGTGTQGTATWNNTEYTYDLVLNPNITLQVGQEELVYCKNNTASLIPNGKPVMAVGTNGNSGNILVDLHDGTKANARRIIGIATEDLAANGYGFVTRNGKVRGINTTGSLYGETWVNGNILYVKATGALTKVEPADTSLKMPVAFVIHAHTNGTLYVRTTGIDENHDRDFINDLVNIHTKTEKTTLADADEVAVASSTDGFSLKKISWANIKATLLNLFVSKDANGNVGINNNAPLQKLHVGGSIIAGDTTYASMGYFIGVMLNNNSTTPSLDIRRWTGSGNNHGVIKIAGNSLGEILFYRDVKSTNTEATTEIMKVDANGNLLIGTSTANGLDKLQIAGAFSSKAVKAFTGIDLNTLKTRTEVCSVSSTCTNLPIAETGYLEVFMFDSNSQWVMQRFTAIGYPNASNQGRTFVRNWMGNNTWSAWVEK